MPLGWARIYGITALENYIMCDEELILENKTDFDCFGDPGIRPWLSVPQHLEVEYLDTISPFTNVIHFVFNQNQLEQLGFAHVTLYLPGDIPDDPEEYADYDGMRVLTRQVHNRDEYFPIEDIEPGVIQLTITGDKIHPILDEIVVENPQRQVVLSEWELQEISGNGDEDVNPGEIYDLYFNSLNCGEDDLEDVIITAINNSMGAFVIDDFDIEIGNIESGEEIRSEQPVHLRIDLDCFDSEAYGIKPSLIVLFQNGEDSWESLLSIETVAPTIRIGEINRRKLP